ncbi:UNVERIFIED_ORG: hypothetical protein J2Y78_001273 [Buttiauxella agrestis ATCC 33320]
MDDAYAYPPYKIPIWHFCINWWMTLTLIHPTKSQSGSSALWWMTLTLIHPTKSKSGISALWWMTLTLIHPTKSKSGISALMVDDAYAYPPYKIPIWHFCINGG